MSSDVNALWTLIDNRDQNLQQITQHLQSKEQSIQGLTTELERRDLDLLGKEQEIASKDRALNAISKEAQQLIAAITEKEQAINDKELEIVAISQEAQQLVAAINDKEQAINDKDAEIVAISQEAQQLIADINDKELEITRKDEEIVAISQEAQQLIAAINDKELEITRKDQEIVAISQEAQQLIVAINEKELELNSKQKAILAVNQQAQVLQASLLEKEAAIQEKELEIQHKQAALLSLDQHLQQALAQESETNRLAENLSLQLAAANEAVNSKDALITTLQQSLEEKEHCIQMQASYLKQSNFFRYYAFNALLRVVNYCLFSLKHSSLFKRSQQVKQGANNKLGRLLARQKSHFKRKFGPFLGVLKQYEPRDMQLPNLQFWQDKTLQSPLLKISLVTPSYQQAAYIERTLNSILDQGYPNLEYFVQDGGSKDGTVDILKAYTSKLSGWESAKDSGQSQAINLGFAKTSGDIMAWLNSDDLLLPGTLAYVADYFARHPTVDVIYGDRIIIDEHDLEIGRWVMPRNDYAVLSWADYIPQETLFWRRAIWEKAGGQIDESFQFAMDWDLLVRFRDAGACINRLPRFLGAFRVHTLQKTSAAIEELGYREMQKIRERCNGFEPSTQEVNDNLSNYLKWHVLEHNFRLIHYKR